MNSGKSSMITKFHVIVPPDHYGVSLKDIVSDTESIPIRLTSFWITSGT